MTFVLQLEEINRTKIRVLALNFGITNTDIEKITNYFELAEKIKEKCKEEFQNTSHNSRHAGRKAKLTDEQIEELKKMRNEEKKTWEEIANYFSITKQTAIKYNKK